MIQRPTTIASVLLLAISTVTASGADQSVWDRCQGTHDAEASITACTRILQAGGETNTNRAIAYYVRAGVYRLKGDNDQAIADYTKAIESNPHYADAYGSRGIVYQAQGDGDHAIADYTKAIEIDPRYAEAYVGRGSVFETEGLRDRAIADFTKTIEITPAGRGSVRSPRSRLPGRRRQQPRDRRFC
jgi:tetratricopeptide (TPR) repeat protein